LPATISNNVPGTEFSLGSDTAINCIVNACDTIKFSASASRNRVFIIEVQGANCGYLATVGGLAAGAFRTYIAEEGIALSDIQRDIEHLKMRFKEEKKQGRIILRNENSSDTYTTEILTSIFKNEGASVFDSRNTILGHLQQGNSPSPLDRIRGTRLAVLCTRFIEGWLEKCFGKNEFYSVYTVEEASACVIGIKDGRIVYSSIKGLEKESDMKKRTSKVAWWQPIRPLVKLLSRY
jgi:6-phosphofructokinase